jgi:hypothetical protein
MFRQEVLMTKLIARISVAAWMVLGVMLLVAAGCHHCCH